MKTTRIVALSFAAVTVGTFVVLFQGCSNAAVEKDVENKVAQENSVNSRDDLQNEASQLISNDKELSPEQKTQLIALRANVKAKVDEMWSTSLKLKSILFKDLVQSKYDESEVELIKDRLRKLESQRLNTMFDAITDANRILGRQATNHQWLARQYFFENAGGQAR